MNNCIVIPIYKNNLDQFEIESINNTLILMHKYDIYFVGPNNLNKEYYINKFINKYNRKNIYFKYFDNFYFKNINSYSFLCLNIIFYKDFLKYDYMLICQPDAWIFNDNLEYFCNKKYDYLGAFVLFNENTIKNIKNIKNTNHILNGGFSLRNIKSFYNICKKYKYDILINYLYWQCPEDGFICNHFYNELNIPIKDKLDLDIIFNFSGETRTREIYPNLCNHLPFGCHRAKNKLFNIFLNND